MCGRLKRKEKNALKFTFLFLILNVDSTVSYKVNPPKVWVEGHGKSPHLQGECPAPLQQAAAKDVPKTHCQQPTCTQPCRVQAPGGKELGGRGAIPCLGRWLSAGLSPHADTWAQGQDPGSRASREVSLAVCLV